MINFSFGYFHHLARYSSEGYERCGMFQQAALEMGSQKRSIHQRVYWSVAEASQLLQAPEQPCSGTAAGFGWFRYLPGFVFSGDFFIIWALLNRHFLNFPRVLKQIQSRCYPFPPTFWLLWVMESKMMVKTICSPCQTKLLIQCKHALAKEQTLWNKVKVCKNKKHSSTGSTIRLLCLCELVWSSLGWDKLQQKHVHQKAVWAAKQQKLT